MPRMLVVCITSTEKLGNQLAIRDPADQRGHADTGPTPCPRVVKQNPNMDLIRLRLVPGPALTIEVEEVIGVLVDVCPGVCSSSGRVQVLFQTRSLLLAPHLASVPTDVQGGATGGTGGVLFQPRPQTGAETQTAGFLLCPVSPRVLGEPLNVPPQ